MNFYMTNWKKDPFTLGSAHSQPNLNGTTLSFIRSSVGCNNPQSSTGGGDAESVEEIRLNSMANFLAIRLLLHL